MPTDLPERPHNQNSEPSPDDRDARHGHDQHTYVPGMIVGSSLVFLGFLTVFLSISGGFEIDYKPLALYFSGLAIWAYSALTNLTLRYTVMTVAITLGLAIAHYGEVHFWHKQAIFWATILMVAYFMFTTAAPDKRD
jgi:cation transport ATPase